VSFESNLDGLRFALSEIDRFDFLLSEKPILEHLLSRHEWREEGIEWTLISGDFRSSLAQADPPNLVFYDFYAPQLCPELWDVESFAMLRAKCKNTELATYSAATPVRMALLLAGFFVGYGPSTSMKNQTTLASTHFEALERPLGPEWLVKLRSSSRAVPWGSDPAQAEAFLRQIEEHPQFLTVSP